MSRTHSEWWHTILCSSVLDFFVFCRHLPASFHLLLKKKNQQNTNQTKQTYQNEKISLFLVHLLIVYFCCVGVVASRYEIIFCFFLNAKLFYQ